MDDEVARGYKRKKEVTHYTTKKHSCFRAIRIVLQCHTGLKCMVQYVLVVFCVQIFDMPTCRNFDVNAPRLVSNSRPATGYRPEHENGLKRFILRQ